MNRSVEVQHLTNTYVMLINIYRPPSIYCNWSLMKLRKWPTCFWQYLTRVSNWLFLSVERPKYTNTWPVNKIFFFNQFYQFSRAILSTNFCIPIYHQIWNWTKQFKQFNSFFSKVSSNANTNNVNPEMLGNFQVLKLQHLNVTLSS